MSDTVERLRTELKDPEMSEGYAESFVDSYIATQIKVLREREGLSQRELADLMGTRQAVVSRFEDVNYSKWNVMTLKKLARAFRVRLKVSFETYGSLLNDVATFSRESLQREPRECDPILNSYTSVQPRLALRAAHRPMRCARPTALKDGAREGINETGRNSIVSGAAAQDNVVRAKAMTAALAGPEINK